MVEAKMRNTLIIIATLLFLTTTVSSICNVSPNNNIYTGTRGTYSVTGTGTFVMESGCSDSGTVYFPYCEKGELHELFYTCICKSGMCIANHVEVFDKIEHLGESREELNGAIVSPNLLNSALDSWIAN